MMNDDVDSSNNCTILAKEENETTDDAALSLEFEDKHLSSCNSTQRADDESNPLNQPVKSLFCSLPLNKIRSVLNYNKTEEDEAPLMKIKQTSRKLLCLYCDRTFVSLNLRHKHVERCHSEKQNRRLSSRKLQSQFTTTACFYCDKLPAEHSLRQLFEHLITDHSQKYFGCLACEERFLNQSILNDHNAIVHHDILPPQQKVLVRIRKEVDNKNKTEENEDDSITSNQTLTRSMTKDKDSTQNSSSLRQLRNKKVSIKASKIGLKKNKRLQNVQSKVTVRKKKTKIVETAKLEETPVKTTEKTKICSINPYPEFDNYYRVKKITDHSIDNLKISSLTFDDVFDKAFFNRIKCNIQENLMYHLDGKLFKNEESENRISNFEKNTPSDISTSSSDTFGCDLTLNAITPVTSILTQNFGEDLESQIEYGSKPSKKKVQSRQDPIRHKYVTRRKYQASIREHKENRDLSKLDMWTQLLIKERQEKVINDKKSAKEMLEYTTCQEYKMKMQRHELNRILDRRGPFEDLKEESSKKAALDKYNAETNHEMSEQCFEEVRIVMTELLNGVVRICSNNEPEITVKLENEKELDKRDIPELPEYLKLRRTSSLRSEEEIDKSDKIVLICSSQETENYELPTNTVRSKNEMIELSGEWARSRLYICAACGLKLPNMKLLLEHKSLYHQNAWVQHYEFVGSQSELYRHLCIPGLGKVGFVEEITPFKQWRRSEARRCTKCEKTCNSLAELHRHILECGGDWTWMLARKKYRYRPFGSRKKKRGLVKRIRERFNQVKTEQTEVTEKKKLKKFEGPRQRPSDADTIQRMLANLPAKRSSRKIICLKDGFPRNHGKHNNKKQVMKCGKVVMQKSALNKEQSLANSTSHKKAASRKAMKNLNRTLSSKILDTNSKLRVKRQLIKNINRRTTRRNSSLSENSHNKNMNENKKSVEKDDDSGKNAKNNNLKQKNISRGLIKEKMSIKTFFPVSKRKNVGKINSNVSSELGVIQESFEKSEIVEKSSSPFPTGCDSFIHSTVAESVVDKLTQTDKKIKQSMSNKRRLRSSFKKVIDRVKKLKLENNSETNERSAENMEISNSFLGLAIKEKLSKILVPLEEPKENSLSIPAFVQSAINNHSPTEESLTPENIFNLEHSSENLLQAKSPMENRLFSEIKKSNPQITATTIMYSNEAINITPSEITEDTHEKEKMSLLSIDTSSKSDKSPLISPLLSPSLLSPKNKGKIRKPNRGLNDCIAMLTKKAFETKPSNENKTIEENKNLAHNNFRETECILKIPVIETESKNMQSEVLDLSKPKKDGEIVEVSKIKNDIESSSCKPKIWNPLHETKSEVQNMDEEELTNLWNQLGSKKIRDKAILKIPKLVDTSWNSIDEIIQKVVENRCCSDVMSSRNLPTPQLKIPTIAIHNSVDNIIEQVVKGEELDSAETISEHDLSETISEATKCQNTRDLNAMIIDENTSTYPTESKLKEIQNNEIVKISSIKIPDIKVVKKIRQKMKSLNSTKEEKALSKNGDSNELLSELKPQVDLKLNGLNPKITSELPNELVNSEINKSGEEKDEESIEVSPTPEAVIEEEKCVEKQPITDSEDDLPLVVLRSKSRSENIIERKEIEDLDKPICESHDTIKDSLNNLSKTSEDEIKQNIENIESLCSSENSPLNKLIIGELPFASDPENRTCKISCKRKKIHGRKTLLRKTRKSLHGKTRKSLNKQKKVMKNDSCNKSDYTEIEAERKPDELLESKLFWNIESLELTTAPNEEVSIKCDRNVKNKEAHPSSLLRVKKMKARRNNHIKRGLSKPKLILKLPKIILKESKLKVDSLKFIDNESEQSKIEVSFNHNLNQSLSSSAQNQQVTDDAKLAKRKSKMNKKRKGKKKAIKVKLHSLDDNVTANVLTENHENVNNTSPISIDENSDKHVHQIYESTTSIDEETIVLNDSKLSPPEVISPIKLNLKNIRKSDIDSRKNDNEYNSDNTASLKFTTTKNSEFAVKSALQKTGILKPARLIPRNLTNEIKTSEITIDCTTKEVSTPEEQFAVSFQLENNFSGSFTSSMINNLDQTVVIPDSTNIACSTEKHLIQSIETLNIEDEKELSSSLEIDHELNQNKKIEENSSLHDTIETNSISETNLSESEKVLTIPEKLSLKSTTKSRKSRKRKIKDKKDIRLPDSEKYTKEINVLVKELSESSDNVSEIVGKNTKRKKNTSKLLSSDSETFTTKQLTNCSSENYEPNSKELLKNLNLGQKIDSYDNNSSEKMKDTFEFEDDLPVTVKSISKHGKNGEKVLTDLNEERNSMKKDIDVEKNSELNLSLEESKIFRDLSPVRKQRSAKAKAIENINCLELSFHELLDISETKDKDLKKRKGNRQKNNSFSTEIVKKAKNTEDVFNKTKNFDEKMDSIDTPFEKPPNKIETITNNPKKDSSDFTDTSSHNKFEEFENNETKVISERIKEKYDIFDEREAEIQDKHSEQSVGPEKLPDIKRGRSAKIKALENLKETSVFDFIYESEAKQTKNKKSKLKKIENISDKIENIEDCYDINKIDEDVNLNSIKPVFTSSNRNKQPNNIDESSRHNLVSKENILSKTSEEDISPLPDNSKDYTQNKVSKPRTIQNHETIRKIQEEREDLLTCSLATTEEINPILITNKTSESTTFEKISSKDFTEKDRNESISEESPNVNGNLEHKRRSRRTCKVNTYNENELVEAIFQHVPSEIERTKKKHPEETKEKKLNNDELFDLLKSTAVENVPKYFREDDTTDNLTDDNFDDVFDDILKKSEALFGEKTDIYKPDDLSDTSKSSDNIPYFKQNDDNKIIDISSSLYCEICNKSFKRSDNLMKHKTTLTHISKLSEIEAKESEKRAKAIQIEETPNFEGDDSKISESDSLYSYPPTPGSDALKIAEILTNSFEKSEIVEQRKYKSLGERKSFESEQGSQNISEKINYEPQISNNTGVILEKQINLLQNIIENRNMDYIDDISMSSYRSLDNVDGTRSPNVENSRNFIFPKNDIENSFIKPIVIEDISNDSLNTKTEDLRARKVLNRDEELFLECCSLLKSSSEVSNFSKKSNKTTSWRTEGEHDMLESENLSKQIIEFSPDNSRIATPLGDSFCDSSNSNASNWDTKREQITNELTRESDISDKADEIPLKNTSNVIKNREEIGADSKPDFTSKMPTKGALKIFEGLKVSIRTEELNLDEVLSNSPPIRKSDNVTCEKQFPMPKIPKVARKSKPIKNKQQNTNDKFIFKVKKKSKESENDYDKEFSDIYDFEETQDNTEVYPNPEFKNKESGDDIVIENNSVGQTLSSSSSSTFSGSKQVEPKKCITKKKHMIMGKIFKNAIKPKTDEELNEIPPIDHDELVENYVLNCPENEDFKKPKMTEEEMNYLFDKLLDGTKKQQTETRSESKISNIKKRIKMRKRQHSNSDSTDDEFGLNKLSKKKPNRKKIKDNSINLEQELKECIGVASRKSQRKCTSGKQNVLVEYWSSDESAFETFLENHLQELSERSDLPVSKIDNYKTDEKKPKMRTKQISTSRKKNAIKKNSPSSEFTNQQLNNSRRKRSAANPLYHWSSSSEDESQDLIEVKSNRDYPDDEYDEDRPIQHGWIVGDSPKKLVTMLAQAKGKKTEPESSVKEQGKKKNIST